jgi:hypothetical protein
VGPTVRLDKTVGPTVSLDKRLDGPHRCGQKTQRALQLVWTRDSVDPTVGLDAVENTTICAPAGVEQHPTAQS